MAFVAGKELFAQAFNGKRLNDIVQPGRVLFGRQQRQPLGRRAARFAFAEHERKPFRGGFKHRPFPLRVKARFSGDKGQTIIGVPLIVHHQHAVIIHLVDKAGHQIPHADPIAHELKIRIQHHFEQSDIFAVRQPCQAGLMKGRNMRIGDGQRRGFTQKMDGREHGFQHLLPGGSAVLLL